MVRPCVRLVCRLVRRPVSTPAGTRAGQPGRPLQVVNRPALVAGGRPAPWEDLAADGRQGLTLAAVVASLEDRGHGGPGPAWVAAGQAGALHEVRPQSAAANQAVPGALAPRRSSVLVALFEEEGEARILLTRRAATLRSHRSEVSFPGGRCEPHETPWEAALREAAEEVGLDRASASSVGWLHPVTTRVSNSLIVPLVAALPGRPECSPNPAEAARVFDVSLAELVAEGVFHEEVWTVPPAADSGGVAPSFPVYFFELAGELVWGATARILYELLTLAVR